MNNVTNSTNRATNTEDKKMTKLTLPEFLARINDYMGRGLSPAETKQALAMWAQREWNNESFAQLALAFSHSRATKSPQPLKEFWERRVEELAEVLHAVNSALIMHPSIATRHLNPVNFSVISVKQRDGFFTAVESEQELLAALRDNPELRELLVRRAGEIRAAEAVRQVWAEIPAEYKAKIVEHHSRFIKDLDESKVVTVNGKKQKASLVRAIAHLNNPNGEAFWAVLGGQFALRALFNLQFFWANSAMFWAEAQRPIAPWERFYRNEADRPLPDDTVYDGEEMKVYEGPFESRQLCGRTLQEQHTDQIAAMDQMEEEFEDAATEADRFADLMAVALKENGVDAPYLYKTYDDGKTFVAVEDKDEAIEHMIAKQEARVVRRVAGVVRRTGRTAERHETREELIANILEGLSEEERAQVEAVLGGAK